MFKIAPIFSVLNRRFNIIILAAGLGTRLRPATDYIPKALVEIAGLRGIDYVIRKYQHVSERLIVASGSCADLLENYVRGRYPSMAVSFSRESVSDLSGPGQSLLYALDYASSRLPTVVTFCDYLIEDDFTVDGDCLAICRADAKDSILGTYKTIALVDEGIILDLQLNDDVENRTLNGFTGIMVCHDTVLLKSIVYGCAARKGASQVDYALDVVRAYVQQVRTAAVPLTSILEFGTEDTLQRTRSLITSFHEERERRHYGDL